MVTRVVEVMRRMKSQKVKKEVKAKVEAEVLGLQQDRKALMAKNVSSSEKQIHDTYSILAHFDKLVN